MHLAQQRSSTSVSTTAGPVTPVDRRRRRRRLPIQRKLDVGASDDPFEREADEVADDVIRRLESSMAGQVPLRRASSTTRIERKGSVAASGDAFTAPAAVERQIQGARGGGTALDPTTRQRFEGAMGEDLSGCASTRTAMPTD